MFTPFYVCDFVAEMKRFLVKKSFYTSRCRENKNNLTIYNNNKRDVESISDSILYCHIVRIKIFFEFYNTIKSMKNRQILIPGPLFRYIKRGA